MRDPRGSGGGLQRNDHPELQGNDYLLGPGCNGSWALVPKRPGTTHFEPPSQHRALPGATHLDPDPLWAPSRKPLSSRPHQDPISSPQHITVCTKMDWTGLICYTSSTEQKALLLHSFWVPRRIRGLLAHSLCHPDKSHGAGDTEKTRKYAPGFPCAPYVACLWGWVGGGCVCMLVRESMCVCV